METLTLSKVNKELTLAQDPERFSVKRSETVFIRRRVFEQESYRFGTNANADEIRADQLKYIGSAFNKSGGILRGLTNDEENLYLPKILGISPQNVDWTKATENYWKNIRKLVPHGLGLKLEVGFAYPDEETADKTEDAFAKTSDFRYKESYGYPINIEDYIIYRYSLVYGAVANSIDDVDASPKIRFYIYSKAKELADNYTAFSSRKKAYEHFFAMLGDKPVKQQMLILFGEPSHTVDQMDNRDIDIILEGYATRESSRFCRLAADKDLALRAFIEKAIEKQKLYRAPNTDIIYFNDNPIGNNIKEVVTYLKDPKNSKTYLQLKAELGMVQIDEEKKTEGLGALRQQTPDVPLMGMTSINTDEFGNIADPPVVTVEVPQGEGSVLDDLAGNAAKVEPPAPTVQPAQTKSKQTWNK